MHIYIYVQNLYYTYSNMISYKYKSEKRPYIFPPSLRQKGCFKILFLLASSDIIYARCVCLPKLSILPLHREREKEKKRDNLPHCNRYMKHRGCDVPRRIAICIFRKSPHPRASVCRRYLSSVAACLPFDLIISFV